MKLERRTISAVLLGVPVLLVGATGCAARHAPAAPVVSTTHVTSAEVGLTNAPTPRTGKAQHASSEHPVRADAHRRGDVFGWK